MPWHLLRTRNAVITAALLISVAGARGVAGQGLTFTASPVARWIQWDDDLGFDDSRLLGGAVGIGFGRYVGLEAYHQEDEGTDLFPGADGAFRSDVAVSGGRVTLSLGSGNFVPFVGAGASVLRLRPDGSDAIKKLGFDYGVGLRTVLAERLQAQVFVEQSQFRLDPAGLQDPSAGAGEAVRRNLSLHAGLGIQLGRRSFDRAEALDNSFAQRYQAPFSGFALAIEPLVGRLDFDEATGLDRQDMVGLRAGLDFGSFFGLRAFHWWGTESDLRTTNGMRAFGGEAQFNLSGGPGLMPYLVGGAARLTWSDRGNGVQPPPADQTAGVVGGGVDFNFGPRVRLTVAARDYILAGSDLAASPDVGSVADPDDLVHNWQFSAGLKLVLGGGGGLRAARPAAVPGPVVQTADSQPALPTEAPVAAPSAAPPTVTTDTVVNPSAGVSPTPTPVQPSPESVPSNVIVIPVPEQGELYVRFGEPARSGSLERLLAEPAGDSAALGSGLDATRLRTIIREELEALAADSAARAESIDEARIRALEMKIDSLVRLLRESVPPPAAPARTPSAEAPAPTEAPATPVDRSPRETRLFTGFTTTAPSQFVFGAGTDLGPLSSAWSFFNVVPSLAFSTGRGHPTFLAQVALEFRTTPVEIGGVSAEPMLSLGAGLAKARSFEAVVPAFAGATFDFGGGEPRTLDGLFVGLQGVDLFNGGRLLVGLRRAR